MSALILNGTRIYHTLSGNHDDDCCLSQDDMSIEHWELLMDCHHQGQCDDDVSEAAKYFEIKDYVQAVNYLIECGIERERFLYKGHVKYPDSVKSRDEIEHEDAVLSYYLWILAGDIQESKDDEHITPELE